MTTSRPAGTAPAAALTVRKRWGVTKLFFSSSPGRLLAVASALIVLIILVASSAALIVNDRQRHIDRVLDQTEPLANAAQQLYSSLSVADAAATSGFIRAGGESQEVRARYDQAMADAAAATVSASVELSDDNSETNHRLAQLSSELTVYAGLVETARTNSRAGNAVGTAYLQEASSLMQDSMLPVAADLYQQRLDAVNDARGLWSSPPWVPIDGLAAVLVGLIAAQWWMTRRDRRRLNLGIVAAAAFTGLSLLWVIIGGFAAMVITSTAASGPGESMDDLTKARITAQQMRASEVLTLARRGTAPSVADFDDKATTIRDALQHYRNTIDDQGTTEIGERAEGALRGWSQSHSSMREALSAGDYDAAVAAVVSTPSSDQPDSTSYQAELDGALEDAIAQSRSAFRADLGNALNAYFLQAAGITALGTLSAISIAAGFWLRMKEYQ